MKITMEVREDAFRNRKTAKQIEEDVRQGALMFWLARGEVEPGDASGVVAALPQEGAASAPPPAEGAPAPREPMLYDLVIQGPNLGEDADFERPRRPRREPPKWDT